jgi:hypothetical protein
VSDIFQQVQDEYRQQQLADFWKKYRLPIIAGVVVLVLGVAGYQAWSYWHGQQVEKSSRELEAIGDLLRNPGNEKTASDRLAKLAVEGSGAYPVLARLQEAALRAQSGDVKAALVLYDSVAKSERTALFRDFAVVRAAVFLVELESYDNVKKKLEPVANGSGPWATQAKELLAYAAWRSGKTEDATKLYEEVEKTPGVAEGAKRRAYEMLALIRTGLKFSDMKAPTSSLLLPQPGAQTGPLLLQPMAPSPEQPGAGSLLGPDPVVPAPAVPSPTPTPTPQ